MAYQIQGNVIVNDSRELIGVNTAGIETALYVGDNIELSSGVVTATSFDGDGANLTNLTAGNLVGALPAIDGSALTGVVADGSIGISSNGTYIGAGFTNVNIAPTGGIEVTAEGTAAGVVTVTYSIGTLPTLDVTGVSTLGGDTSVDGTLSATNVSVSSSVTAATYYGDGSGLTGIAAGSVDLTGTDQSFRSLGLTGAGVALTVTNESQFNGTVTLGAGAEIHGPANIVIDPATVGDDTGSVTIKGDLIVNGTEFIVNSTTVNIADKKIGLATNITTDALLDGSGFTVGEPGSAVEKSFLYNDTTKVPRIFYWFGRNCWRFI